MRRELCIPVVWSVVARRRRSGPLIQSGGCSGPVVAAQLAAHFVSDIFVACYQVDCLMARENGKLKTEKGLEKIMFQRLLSLSKQVEGDS